MTSFARSSFFADLSSSSSPPAKTFAEICPFLIRSPIWRISSCTQALRARAFMIRRSPRSMRRAMRTSPSRVSNGTVPISRRYMRTGSLVFSRGPGTTPSFPSSSFSSFAASLGAGAEPLGPSCSRASASTTVMPCASRREKTSSISSGEAEISSGSDSLISSYARKPRSLPTASSWRTSSYLASTPEIGSRFFLLIVLSTSA